MRRKAFQELEVDPTNKYRHGPGGQNRRLGEGTPPLENTLLLSGRASCYKGQNKCLLNE